MIKIGRYELLLDSAVERQIVHFWTYASMNRRVGRSEVQRPVRDVLTVRLVDKRTKRSTTLKRLVEKVMGAAPAMSEPVAPNVWDFRAVSPMEWLRELPTGISPKLDPPQKLKPGKAVRVSGRHPVKAILIDSDVELPEPVYAYDNAAGFGIKMNSRSLVKHLHGENAHRRHTSSLYDFRSSAFFLVYD